jgi:hypothetical protein
MAQSNVTATSQQFTIQEPQSVVLNSPNSGSFNYNQNISFTWTKNNFTENVDFYYTTSTTFSTTYNIVYNYNANSFSWNPPSSLSGVNVYIWVRKNNDSTVKDRSNSAIAITPITITKTIAESLVSSDSDSKTTGLWKRLRTIAEGLTTSDSDSNTSRVWKYLRTISEGLTTSDSDSKTTRIWKYLRTIAEGLTSSDSSSVTSRNWIKIKTIAEGLTSSDTSSKIEREWIKIKTIAEELPVTDTDSKVSRLWIKVRSIAEQLNPIDTSSEGHLRLVDEVIAVSDSWIKSIQRKSTLYQLDGGGTDESFISLYKTGWIMPKHLGKTSIVRRINLDYSSDSPITVKVYKDDDLSNPMTTKTFNASSSSTHDSIRLGTRVKYFLISIETTQSANETTRIERIEIEVDN